MVGHTDSTCRKAGQYPGGRGCGRKRRPSGHRRDRAIYTDGDIQPERVLTSHGSSRENRKEGDGTHGPNGWATYGTERPWLSAHQLAPDRLAQSGADSPKPALSDLPSGLRHGRSIGVSGMRGNSHVPFLGGGGLATGSCYPTVCSAPASGSSSGLAFGFKRPVVLG